MLGGFLNVFQDIKVTQFADTFKDLTFGELLSMAMPFAIGLWAISHQGDIQIDRRKE